MVLNLIKTIFFAKIPAFDYCQELRQNTSWSDVMFEVNPVINQIKEIRERTDQLRGYL